LRAAALALLFAWPLAAAPAKPNLLLITLDTTRADRLGCYGDQRAKTPTLDALAARGALFAQAHAHVPLTLPSHATILTGRLPPSLKLPVNGVALNASVPTLATHLAARGYATRAVVGSVILDREFGLSRGFEVYDDRIRGDERRADAVTAVALDVAKDLEPPYFLWVHYYDPHFPYVAAKSYDGEIAFMDSAIAELLRGLRGRGLLDQTLIVVAGDHGESLSRHGEKQHGVFLYEETMHVPLIMSWPEHIRAGSKVNALCGLADVASTILDLLGAGALPESDGTSLRPLLDGKTLPSRVLYIESYHGAYTYGWAPMRGVMDDRWKYIDAPRPELYMWRISEDTNLASARRDALRVARAELQQFPAQSSQPPRVSAEAQKQLTSLGYLSASGMMQASALDPKDVIGIEDDLVRAKEARDVRSGMRILKDVLARNPSNIPAWSMLGIAYMTTGDYDAARSCFERETRLRPEMSGSHVNLGTAWKKLGKNDRAMEEYKTALALSPREADAAVILARMYRDRGASADARRALETTLATGDDTADIEFELGLLEVEAQNWDGARAAFTKAMVLDPGRDDASVNLGKIAWKLGRTDEAIAAYRRASRIAPRNAAYLATLGSLYLNGKNDLRQALELYQQALRADPNGTDATNLRELIAGLEAQTKNY
jgi:arylsulfatase A-like enzyme/cytochrome c-type biogenesis protein CcmH/NrfG